MEKNRETCRFWNVGHYQRSYRSFSRGELFFSRCWMQLYPMEFFWEYFIRAITFIVARVCANPEFFSSCQTTRIRFEVVFILINRYFHRNWCLIDHAYNLSRTRRKWSLDIFPHCVSLRVNGYLETFCLKIECLIVRYYAIKHLLSLDYGWFSS